MNDATNSKESNIRIYLDSINRLIMAELIEEKSTAWVVKNPLILHVQSIQGQINIQFFPVMFREFQADKDEPTIWTVDLANMTPCNQITLDARLISQYKNIFAPVKSIPPVMNMTPSMQGGMPAGMPPEGAPNTNPNVIKLFDDK